MSNKDEDHEKGIDEEPEEDQLGEVEEIPDDISDMEMGQFNCRMPVEWMESLKEKLPYGGLTELARDAFREELYGEELGKRSMLQRELNRLEETRQDKRSGIREEQVDLERIEDRISTVQTKLSERSTRKDQFEGAFDSLEMTLREGGVHMVPELTQVKRVARVGGLEPDQVIARLRERNPDVPNYAFEAPALTSERWGGLPEDEIETPVDER